MCVITVSTVQLQTPEQLQCLYICLRAVNLEIEYVPVVDHVRTSELVVCEGTDLACSCPNHYSTNLPDYFIGFCINRCQEISRANIPLAHQQQTDSFIRRGCSATVGPV